MSLLAIYVLSGLTGVGVGIATPLIPLLLQHRGASGGEIGLAASTMFAALAMAALATGWVVDRRGPKPGLVMGSVLFAAALASMPLAPGYVWLLAVRAVEGCGIGILTVCLETAINLLVADRNRGKAMGVYSLVFAGGVTVGPSVGVLFPGDFRLPFVVAAVISLVAGAVAVAAFRNIAVGARPSGASYEGLIACTWGPLVGVLCYALIEVTMISLYPVYLASRNMEPRHIGVLFALYAGGAVVAPLIVGVISDRIRRERVMIGCGLILAIAVGGLWVSETRTSMVTATAMMGLAAGAIYPTGLSIIGDRVAPARLGSGNSLYTTAYSLGSVVGPTSVGVVIDRSGARMMFVPLLAIAVAFVVLMVVDAFSRGRPRYVVAGAKDAAV